MTIIIETIIILLLSAFFSGMEIAFVSSSKLKVEIDKQGQGLSSRVQGLFYSHPTGFISTLLVAGNIALVIYGILMASIIEQFILLPAGLATQGPLPLIIETVLSTLVVLVVGEYIPKAIFRINPNGMMHVFALPALFFYITLYPVSKTVSLLSRLLLRIAGVKTRNKHLPSTCKKVDLDYLLQSHIDDAKGERDIEEEIKLFQNALEFRGVKVRECIVPRNEINAVPTDASLETLRSQFIQSGHSKIIVYKQDIDEIVGFVHASEMFNLTDGDDWTPAIKDVSIVPETLSAQKLLQSLLSQKRSVAVVVDEFGGTSGIVTLEDLVEEIFGEIEDEHDRENYVAQDLGRGEYLLSARLEIERVNDMFDLGLPESEEYLTVGGLILHVCQSLPKRGDAVRIGKWEFQILKSTSTKIELVRLREKG